uniref:Profilin-A n=1 Tax=Physarum polycephalum TaxID=5791 RepID=PROF1_PHYPO|nr:RecName: Full=Profilin-A [Physarum polycephalum]AAA63523.1 profilin A [Physarum polycephalum]|eukprot:Phypoly_transcript_24764.p1 GENE.Phypoly_transcript_24764~~Phypoly_transcript_24764.p1  ORF type:complete len:126 (+),score=21.19 Phypoly_transcript_24764:40-417(+)
MSWQAYVDDQLVGTGHVIGAAIIGHDGNVWASKNLSLKAGEGAKIVNGFKDSASVLSGGIFVDGQKYLTIKADDKSIYGKKGAGGVVLVKTGQSVLIGHYNETIQPGQATTVVEKLADYLRENGY